MPLDAASSSRSLRFFSNSSVRDLSSSALRSAAACLRSSISRKRVALRSCSSAA
jgi:hypothetical protein